MSSRRKPKDALYLYNTHLDKLLPNLVDDIEAYDSIVNEDFGYPTVEYGLNKKKMDVKSSLQRWV